VSLQFAIGVAAHRPSLLSLPARLNAVASNLGAACLVAVYLLVARSASRPVRRGNPYLAADGAAHDLALSDSTVNRLLAGRAIVYVGTISYSLYLSHFVTPNFAFYGEMPTFNLVAVVCHATHFLTAFALTVTLATGIYRLVEAPGRRVMRAAAGRLPGLGRPTRIAREQAEPAG
jgi:peptidoglycan/LPS O-acetylase OafA/YrhL